MARTLNALFAYLDGLTERAALQDLAAVMAELEVDCEDFAEFIRFSEQGYGAT